MLKSTAFDEPPASAHDRQRVLEAQCPAGRQLQLRAILVGRVRYTVDEDRTFLPFEWNAAEPCDQGFIGLAAVDPGVQTFTRLPCGASMVVMYLHDARRWTGSAGHGILTA
jgi:hypothetical protein